MKEIETGAKHGRWSAYIVFTVFWSRMIFQIVVIKDLVNKTNVALPVVLRERF